ncbi:E3 ubiquitin-protein ligase MARCHF8-like [Oppia nitens]|uniref:E3 ubiquitin-protein ligase MARCHF8-like n=1 Tax=Oppia nitens TaxID=1686743 RepID=UPI0023DBA927|nr:E3 ubiquitin-protein ligase MARCHF8-like [Oppia nitens]
MAKQSTSCDNTVNHYPIRGGGPVLIDGSTDLIELESDQSLDDLYLCAKTESNDITAGSSKNTNNTQIKKQKSQQNSNKLSKVSNIKYICQSVNNKEENIENDDEDSEEMDDEMDDNKRLNVNTISCRPISETSLVSEMTVSTDSLSDPNSPMCKICHMNAKDNDPLISPCRCSGTMQYMHCGCLMRWLEITSKKSRKPLSCELCQYQYQWHKKFKVSHWQFPHCSRNDKILHSLFMVSLGVMACCAIITIMCFKQDRGHRVETNQAELTQSEIVTLICGVLFFLAFFMAMYVEVKARHTIYKLFIKFIYLNQQWYIDEYDKKDCQPVHV